jgi:hypothetical protein
MSEKKYRMEQKANRVPICGATGKAIFKSAESAQEFLNAHPGTLRRYYPCPFAPHYHLTSQEFNTGSARR